MDAKDIFVKACGQDDDSDRLPQEHADDLYQRACSQEQWIQLPNSLARHPNMVLNATDQEDANVQHDHPDAQEADDLHDNPNVQKADDQPPNEQKGDGTDLFGMD